jgi:iron complex transport system substrate-binding protein
LRLALAALAGLWVAGAGLAEPPRRIVSTAPSITETLFALGLGERVAGVTTFCNYPEEARRLPKIGTYIQPNLEVIVGLRPDLVVVETNPIRLREKLEALGLRVLELQFTSVGDIYRSIERLGQAAAVPERAKALAGSIHSQLDEIRRRTAPLPERRMLLLVGRTPNALEGLIAVGKASYLNELITIAGGANIFRDAPTAYPKVSLEEILARNPEVIVDMGEMARTRGVTEADKQRVVRLWERYPSLTAVRTRRVFAVASDIFVVPGPRMVEAARAFARMLHPEAGL